MITEEFGLREKILETATCLFIEHGYHGLAMREISEKLGVSKTALYYHFKDKEELFIAILSRNLNEIETEIGFIQTKPISCSEKIIQFTQYVLTQPAEKRAVIRLGSQEINQVSATSRMLFEVIYYEKFIGRLQKIFQAGVENGEFRAVDPDAAIWALLGIMYPYLYPNYSDSSTLDPKRIQMIIGIFMNGVKQPNP